MQFAIRIALALLVLLPAAPAQAQERLVSPALPGFVEGHAARNHEQSIREEVPRGESVEAWTAMVTTQWFAFEGITLEGFVANFLGGLERACPAARVEGPVAVEGHGAPAVRFAADCPRSPATGRRETMQVLAILGDALHVKQVAFRDGYAGNRDWAEGFLNATRLCRRDC